jgi:hypothetical protein
MPDVQEPLRLFFVTRYRILRVTHRWHPPWWWYNVRIIATALCVAVLLLLVVTVWASLTVRS